MHFRKVFLSLFSVGCISLSIMGTSFECFAQDVSVSNMEKEFQAWKKNFKKIALEKGVKKSILNKELDDAKLLRNVLESDKKQSEFLLSFWDYTSRTLCESRIKKGREIFKEYQSFLKSISEKYGVDETYLIAFWGLETNYGLYKGNIKTVDALSTLAFDKRRRNFFSNELITLLKLKGMGEKTSFYGSWAGAFGNFQFMPTTYAAYAVDADGDGNKDVINSLPDAFSSAANYLSQMGWDSQTSWGREVQLKKNVSWKKLNAQDKRTVKEWIKLGVHPLSPLQKNEENVEAKLLLPMGINGPKFLTYPNFDKILRWNNSTLYALSVGLLSDMIKDENFQLKAKRYDYRVTKSDVKMIQEKLLNKKLYKGDIDGILGSGTRKSIIAYQRINGLPQDGYPSAILIKKLTKEK